MLFLLIKYVKILEKNFNFIFEHYKPSMNTLLAVVSDLKILFQEICFVLYTSGFYKSKYQLKLNNVRSYSFGTKTPRQWRPLVLAATRLVSLAFRLVEDNRHGGSQHKRTALARLPTVVLQATFGPSNIEL